MSTIKGVVVVARAADGTETDVTAGVQALYDGVIGSMDWGSGFWSAEDAVPVAEIAEVCGFAGADEPRRYLRERRREDRRDELCKSGLSFYDAIEQAKREFPDE